MRRLERFALEEQIEQDIVALAGHRVVPPWVMKLVADAVAAERDRNADDIKRAEKRGAETAREACAQLCDRLAAKGWPHAHAADCSDMIRKMEL